MIKACQTQQFGQLSTLERFFIWPAHVGHILGDAMRFALPRLAQTKICLGAATISVAVCLGATAQAADDKYGVYLTLEGILGENSSQRTGLNYIYTDAPLVENSWEGFGAEIEQLNGGRVEAGFQSETATGTPFLLGVSYTRLSSEKSNSGSVYGWVYGEPPEIPGEKPQAEIRLCPDGPCQSISTSVDHAYWEITPKFSMAVAGADGNFFWLGLQPFYGEIDQTSFTATQSQGVDNTLSADLYGALLTGQKDFRLSDRNTLSVSAGFGLYVVEADGFSKGREEGEEVRGSQKADGTRAQLGVSLNHELRSNISLGAAARLDYWSDQPYIITASSTAVRCELRGSDPVCEPPSVRAFSDNVRFDDMMDYFLGLNVTFRY